MTFHSLDFCPNNLDLTQQIRTQAETAGEVQVVVSAQCYHCAGQNAVAGKGFDEIVPHPDRSAGEIAVRIGLVQVDQGCIQVSGNIFGASTGGGLVIVNGFDNI